MTEDSFGNYVYVKKRVTLYPGSPSTYGILDTAGNQVTQTEIPDDATNVMACSDGGFVISGKLIQDYYLLNNIPIFIIKTDENLNYSAINLRSPIDSQTLNIFSNYDINGILRMLTL